MKKSSLIRRLTAAMAAQMILLALLVFLLTVTVVTNARAELGDEAENLLTVYQVSLENRIIRADNVLKNLVIDYETELALMMSDSEADRYYARKAIWDSIYTTAAEDDTIEALVVAELPYGTNLVADGVSLTGTEKQELRDFAVALLQSGERCNSWQVAQIGQTPYLYRAYVQSGRIVVAYISAESFLSTSYVAQYEELSLLLTDSDNTAWAVLGRTVADWQIGRTAAAPDSTLYVMRTRTLANGSMQLSCCLATGGLWGMVRSSAVVLVLIGAVVLVFSLALVRYMRRQVLAPLDDMTENLRQMQESARPLRIETSYDNREFTILRDTFNTLMQENIELQLKTFAHNLELRDTELRCIRLQLRPHFFLNAMTTISSLSMQGRNDEIRRYIDVLSKNVRYMFRSGLHTVPLGEELQNVQAYIDMQELKYPGSVFYCATCEPALESWPIPQMLIHTVIENEYKHTVSVDSLVAILVHVQQVEQNGEPMLCIEIEDDGKGYPPEILQEFAMPEASAAPNGDGSHLGLRSLRTMLRLMYEREDLMQLQNMTPHGAKARFLIPKKAVCEYNAVQKGAADGTRADR